METEAAHYASHSGSRQEPPLLPSLLLLLQPRLELESDSPTLVLPKLKIRRCHLSYERWQLSGWLLATARDQPSLSPFS